ncbi:MAG: hypothetical protein WCB68_04230 [Pyrinomonadaceae bacterium]
MASVVSVLEYKKQEEGSRKGARREKHKLANYLNASLRSLVLLFFAPLREPNSFHLRQD